MTTDQRLERIEKKLDALLEVERVKSDYGACVIGPPFPSSNYERARKRIKDTLKPIEHPKPAPEGETMRERCRRLTDDVGG